MGTHDFDIVPETHALAHCVESLQDGVLGETRWTRASHWIRQACTLSPVFGFVAIATPDRLPCEGHAGQTLGSVRFTRVAIAPHPERERPCTLNERWDRHRQDRILLLGPLVVLPAYAGRGIGRALVARGVKQATLAGIRLILLVGDRSYYARCGFLPVPNLQIHLPGPVDTRRVLYRISGEAQISDFAGTIQAL